LRINAPQTFGVLHLAHLWPQFLKRHPQIELDVTLTDRVVDLVDEGFDLGIRISRGGSQTHVARRLATSRNVLCASPDYVARHGLPQSPEELEHHGCVVYGYAPVPGNGPSPIPRVRSGGSGCAPAFAPTAAIRPAPSLWPVRR
jgi:DNA-binding transcriptional LysR family regulator